MLTLQEVREHFPKMERDQIDELRRLPEWNLGYALGRIPPDHAMFCDLDHATGIYIVLADRKPQCNLRAFTLGWLDGGRELRAPSSLVRAKAVTQSICWAAKQMGDMDRRLN